jgi:hypothetical protein
MTRLHDSRVLLVALVLPIALTAVALGVVLGWLPQLPATVAIHWGAHGADGYAPRATLPVLLAVVGFGIPLLLGGIVVLTARGALSFVQKGLAVLSLATTVLIALTFLGMTGAQRGLDDARQAPGTGPTLLVAFGAALVIGVVAWFVLPKWSRADAAWRVASPMSLAADERAIWLGSTRFPGWTIAAILVPVLLLSAGSSWVAAHRGGAAWLLLAIPVIVLVALLSSTDWRVRVDADGLRVRSILGFPRWTIPLDDIAEAGTTTVAAMGDFGGWGVRWASRRRVGIITRSGPALEVRRRDGSSLVITVDDADSAAALLTARVAARS